MRRSWKQARVRRRGFTLMEVLLVLAILVILGSMVGFYFVGAQKGALVKSAKSQMAMFKTPLNMYYADVGSYPSRLDGLIAAPPDLKNPAKWGGPYMEKTIPADPWGNPYVYEASGDQYMVRSSGPDGQPNTADDIEP